MQQRKIVVPSVPDDWQLFNRLFLADSSFTVANLPGASHRNDYGIKALEGRENTMAFNKEPEIQRQEHSLSSQDFCTS